MKFLDDLVMGQFDLFFSPFFLFFFFLLKDDAITAILDNTQQNLCPNHPTKVPRCFPGHAYLNPLNPDLTPQTTSLRCRINPPRHEQTPGRHFLGVKITPALGFMISLMKKL